MRVLACKIHCPSFICFCKPSPSAASHLSNSNSLPFKLQNSPHPHASPQFPLKEEAEEDEEEEDNSVEAGDTILRSCIKKEKFPSASLEKKKVQWVDSLGKQLVDIKEFESSETGDTDNEEEIGGCLCNIL